MAKKILIGTQNTSIKMLTRRKKTTWQFLIGTEMRLFGVLCRPEAEPGDLAMRNCLTTDHWPPATDHRSQPSAWRAVASDKQGPWRAVAFGEGGAWRAVASGEGG